MPTETDFHRAIIADPGNPISWLLWADWLEENGYGAQGEVIRLRSDLTRAIDVPERDTKEARLRELVCERQLKPPVVALTNSIGMMLHLIPPGRYRMGSPATEPGRYDDEFAVAVDLTQGYWIGKYPVTQRQYQLVMGHNPSRFPLAPMHPVERVSYVEVLSFCQQLTELDHYRDSVSTAWRYRLPTEAEWEYACRAGSSTRYYFGDAAELLHDFAWVGQMTTHPVGQQRNNAWDLADMLGNVYEWCQDWYHYRLGGGSDPKGPETGVWRSSRGGCYISPVDHLRCAWRLGNRSPKHRYATLGFRVVLAPVEPSLLVLF